MRRFYVISIYYKNDEFVDMCITDKEITPSMIHKSCSTKCSLPIKIIDEYLREYFQIIYMENVPGIDTYCYLKRNPVTGKFSCKGVKDIDRVNILCKHASTKNYSKYCELMNNISHLNLNTMKKDDRDKLFITLREII